jgi:hypothetical protein
MKLIGCVNTTRVLVPYFIKIKGLKFACFNDTILILMELKYMVLTFLHFENQYAMFCLQTYMKVGITTLMIKVKFPKHEFFTMWHVNDLILKKYLLYSLICNYFILDP